MKKVLLCSLLLSADLNAMNGVAEENAGHGIRHYVCNLCNSFMSKIRNYWRRRQLNLDQALVYAVTNDDPGAIETAFRCGGNLNVQLPLQRESIPLVSYAIRQSYIRAACTLISLGCDVNAVSSMMTTPLIELALNRKLDNWRIEIGRLLLDRGANINAKNYAGNSALMYACYWAERLDFVRFLLTRGAEINALNETGITALHVAVLYSNDDDTVQLLIDAGANLEAKEGDGKTPFSAAVPEGLSDKVRYLASAGADINAQDNLGRTPVHTAVFYGRIEMLNTLIELGCNLNIPDNNGNTPFYLAISGGRSEMVRLLYASGAVMDVPNNAGMTVSDIISGWPHQGRTAWQRDVLRILGMYNLNDQEKLLLDSHYRSATPYQINSVTAGNADVDVNAVNGYGENIFHLMAYGIRRGEWIKEKAAILDSLIDIGCDISMQNDKGESPLHIIAAKTNCLYTDGEAINYFSARMDVNIRDKKRDTPLHIAANQDGNSIVMIEALLQCPAILIDAKNMNGNTPLHLAVMNGAYRLVRLLLKRGADPDIANNAKQTPRMLAQKNDCMLRLFEKTE